MSQTGGKTPSGLGALFLGCLIWTAGAHAQNAVGCQDTRVPLKIQWSNDISTLNLPAADYLDVINACNTVVGADHPPLEQPASLWLQAERKAYSTALQKTSADILVVPFQVQGYGLDRIERALMTIDLAYELGAKTSVLDPQLVSRALGEGARRFDTAAILRLAELTGVHRIVVGYVGHDRHRSMTLTVQVMDVSRGANGDPSRNALRQKDWRSIPFTDQTPPATVFHDMLPQIVRELGMPSGGTRTPSGRQDVAPTDFELSLADLLTAGKSGLTTSAALTLLGALASPPELQPIAPASPELPRERLFERAFVLSKRLDPASQQSTFVQAYALMSLHRRPAALATLGSSHRPDAVTLRARLNGDLPGALAALSTVHDPYERLLLEIAVQDLRQAYGVEGTPDATAARAIFGRRQGEWLPLVKSRFSDPDSLTVDSPGDIKILLDRALPVAGMDMRSISEGRVLGTAPDDDEQVALDIAIARHIRAVVGNTTPSPCCTSSSGQVTPWDLLALFESRAEARIAKSMFLASVVRGSPRAAVSQLDRYEPYFSGHPMLAAVRAQAAVALANGGPDDSRAMWQAQVAQYGLLAATLSPGENLTAWLGIIALKDGPQKSILFDAYGYDFPRRSLWPAIFIGQQAVFEADVYKALSQESLDYSQLDFDATTVLAVGSAEDRHRLYTELQSRFIGAPGRIDTLASIQPQDAAKVDELERLRGAISSDPGEWWNYMNLARELVRQRSDYAGAADVLLSYPPFHTGIGNPITLSNLAFEAASMLYLHGHADLSKDLYRLSAGFGSGSEAEMTSSIRLQLLDGNFDAVIAGSLERARRYPSAYAFRDYLSYLHAIGNAEQAWRGFSEVNAAFDLPQVWISALVGHQMEGRSDAYIRDWLNRPEIRTAHYGVRQFAPWFAVLWNTTDHEPPSDLGRLVESLETGPAARIGDDGITVLVPDPQDPDKLKPINQSALRESNLPRLAPGTPLKSALTDFAVAYVKLRQGRWVEAFKEFSTMADYYPIDGESSPYVFALPYFSMTAAMTGDKNGLEMTLQSYKSVTSFDLFLSRAIFAGARKDTDAAQSMLRSAFNIRPNTDFRPIMTEYEYAETCEWIYRQTNDQRFVNMLLEWTEQYEKIQPTHAWAYAMEYSYLEPGARRTRALAMTLYLDPDSYRIKKAAAEETRQAREWLKTNNPFLRKPSSPPSDAQMSL